MLISRSTKQTVSALVAVAIVGLNLAPVINQPAVAQRAVPKVSAHQNRQVLQLKLTEASAASFQAGQFSSANSDVASLNQILNQKGVKLEPLFSRSQAELKAAKIQGERESGRELADLSLWYRLRLSSKASAEDVLQALYANPLVEEAYAEPLPAPAPTADYSGMQKYEGAAPVGLNSYYGLTLPGGNGSKVRVFDLEYGWNQNHEDVPKAKTAFIQNGAQPNNPYSNDHGTAVIGMISANRNNGYGMSGMAPGAALGLINTYSLDRGWDMANAISVAMANGQKGDVILIEQQVDGPYGYMPAEYYSSVYDAIANATANGFNVIEPAGNGSQNLNDPGYGSSFPFGKPDSGAIIVGAGQPGVTCTASNYPPRSAIDFSNYGNRVNLQGWGNCVPTTGYGDLSQTNENATYTGYFSGTSSASPMVAAAAASLSSAYEALNGTNPTPAWVRATLIATGTPQNFGPGSLNRHIGPLPDLAKALVKIDVKAPASFGLFAWVEQPANNVKLAWGQSSDNVGVTQYRIMRNGAVVSTFPAGPGPFGWTDNSVTAHSTYSYYVQARDAAGNWSLPTKTVTVQTK